MRPNIGLLNLSSHENYLLDLCKITAEIANVTVFTTEGICKRIIGKTSTLQNDINWVTKKDHETDHSFLSRIQSQEMVNLDSLISFPFYGTIFDYLQYDNFNPNCQFILFAYDLNGWIGREIGLTPKIYNYLKYPIKQKFLKKIDLLLVEFEPIMVYARNHFHETTVETFTSVIHKNNIKESSELSQAHDQESPITITVPGLIDESRREYETILRALESLSNIGMNDIEFVLLGQPVGDYGESIIRRAKKFEGPRMKVVSFHNWIPEKEFSHYIEKSNLLISPLRRTRKSDGFVEHYGQSKGSGAISDAIRNATPLLLPEWYEVPDRLMPGINTFKSDNDLSRIVSKFIKDNKIRQNLKEGAKEAASEYTRTKQKKRLHEIIQL
ncbi:glycosyltransferase [Natrinema versiforme]|uniref:Glycosyltransferase n=1 Tax=Natrinema versiforme TaxID=88724 RepID=A0A4V1FZJ0_9EURY|nr:glycosyltransferase [Natrinema versiforme]QCS42016.1 glycosyltransferase [Natrinema versiforme]